MQITKKKLYQNIITITILFITVYSILPYPNNIVKPLFLLINITVIWWSVFAMTLLIYWLSRVYFFDKKNNNLNMYSVYFYVVWNVVCIIRGVFIAEDYWDWKSLLNNSFALLLPIVAFVATNILITQSILKLYIKYILPFFIIILFIIPPDAFGSFLVPVSFLVLFLPLLPNKWKIILLLITLIIFTSDLGARSSVIKFLVPLMVLLIYYFRRFISHSFLKILLILLFTAPILFFLLGITGVFNVFKMDEYVKGDYNLVEKDENGGKIESSLKDDTRTILYEEVLKSSKDENSWLFGRTPARGNETEEFASLSLITGRKERNGNEVAILNIFTWTGLVGVILYMFVFIKASYLAVNRSRNIFAKLLGLYLSFRWLYAWVEDINYMTLTTYMLWVMLGLCFSSSFRIMTDREVLIWVRGIFDNRYRLLGLYQKQKKELWKAKK